MKVVTKNEMEQIDTETSSEYKIPSTILMENAGIAIAQKITEIYPKIKKNTASLLPALAILVGPGNNGGDGLVIARFFFTQKKAVHIYIIGNRDKFKGDSLLNLEIAEKLSIPLSIIDSSNEWQKQKNKVLSHTILVDALFGTGLKGEVRDFYKQVIQDINKKTTLKVIAVDVPSGLLSIEDSQNKSVIKANHTITVGLPKIGMVDYPGKSFIGELHIVQIGFPESLLTHKRIHANLITCNAASELLPKRDSTSHKGIFGHLLVIAGSKKFTGAALLTCQAALRTGCGLVTLASVPSVCQTIRNCFPEAILLELPETDEGTISSDAFPLLQKRLSQYQALVFGPGVGQSVSTGQLINLLLLNYEGNILIDADGLNLLSQQLNLLKKDRKSNVILTPHIKEMSMLVQKTSFDVMHQKIALSREFSKKYNVVNVLKSAVTLISDRTGEIFFNSSGNEGMATGGTGDVLSGMIGSFMTQGLGVLESSILGVYLHGLAGDYAKKNLSSASLVASDLISNFHFAFNELIQSKVR